MYTREAFFYSLWVAAATGDISKTAEYIPHPVLGKVDNDLLSTRSPTDGVVLVRVILAVVRSARPSVARDVVVQARTAYRTVADALVRKLVPAPSLSGYMTV